jgi:hypothetical protein
LEYNGFKILYGCRVMILRFLVCMYGNGLIEEYFIPYQKGLIQVVYYRSFLA